MSGTGVEDLLRELAPQVIGVLARRHGQFDACEDAVQEALLAAALQWPEAGFPDNPRGWLIAVAEHRLVDDMRSESARRRRELDRAGAEQGAAAADGRPQDADDTLTLLFLCCHPALTPASQLALTLRSVGGLTTAEIAHAFLVPEATMARRIARAKGRLRAAGARFEPPPLGERTERLSVVLHVLYLIFTEGHTATAGADLQRADLRREALRLARMLHRLLPDDGEVAGLLALMLLVDARSAARTDTGGRLVPFAEQDRGLWDRAAIDEGIALVTATLATAPLGPYQLQAAIAAVHAEAARAEDTDWPQVAALYALLERTWPNPMVTLNRAVAVAMVDGPQAGLDLLEPLHGDERMCGHHRLAAVRGHLAEMAGDRDEARRNYRMAARLTTSMPEQRYLRGKVSELTNPALEAPSLDP